MDKEKKIIEIRKVLLKHTNEVDNWNDAIFDQDFDELVEDLFALHDVIVSCCEPIGEGFFLGTTCPKCKRPFRQVIE